MFEIGLSENVCGTCVLRLSWPHVKLIKMLAFRMDTGEGHIPSGKNNPQNLVCKIPDTPRLRSIDGHDDTTV